MSIKSKTNKTVSVLVIIKARFFYYFKKNLNQSTKKNISHSICTTSPLTILSERHLIDDVLLNFSTIN